MLPQVFKQWIDSQYERPRGIIGTYIGEKMVRQHRIEVAWTLDQLSVQPSSTILELGCGAGDALASSLRKWPDAQVIGLDRSPTMVASAKKRNNRALQAKRVNVLQGEFQSIPLPNASVGCIFSVHTLYFWQDIGLVLAEIDRVLKPGGTFVITYCDGKGDIHWDGIETSVHDQFIPSVQKMGYHDVSIERGPDSRDYHTAAITGRKAD